MSKLIFGICCFVFPLLLVLSIWRNEIGLGIVQTERFVQIISSFNWDFEFTLNGLQQIVDGLNTPISNITDFATQIFSFLNIIYIPLYFISDFIQFILKVLYLVVQLVGLVLT